MNLASDNWAGASPEVATAVTETAHGTRPAYGGDDITQALAGRFSALFERDVAVFPVATGTAANAMAIAAFGAPGGIVLCHEDAHIATDEAGAVSFFGGGLTMAPLPGHGGKLDPDTVRRKLARYEEGAHRLGRPCVLSLSNLTEWGQAYAPEEISALVEVARGRGLAVHVDGARFAGAVASRGVSPADLTWRAGVDALSFGGTKNGCLLAEAVVFFDRDRAEAFAHARQRAGHALSKAWFVAAQFTAYLDNGHWLDLARRANIAAAGIAQAINASLSAELMLQPDANQVFARLTHQAAARLEAAGVQFYPWEDWDPVDGMGACRFVTSFATSEAEVAAFAKALGG